MNKPIRLTFAAALAVSVVAGAPGVAAAAPTCEWKSTEFDPVAGTDSSSAAKANGDVVAGYAEKGDNGRERIVTWDKNGKVTKNYGEIPSSGSAKITDVSSDGTIIGYGWVDFFGAAHGFVSHNGELKLIAGNDGSKQSTPLGINEKGVIVGVAGTKDTPATWQADQPGKYRELTGLPKGTTPADIDEDGSILLKGGEGSKDYVWRDGKTTELKLPAGTEASPSEISNGHVIGSVSSEDDNGVSKGIYWDKNGEPTVVEGGRYLTGVSEDGVIAGWDDATNRSGVWKQGKHVTWLGKAPEVDVRGVSPDGRIVGFSENKKVALAWHCG